jgi:hypothetical protein
MARLFGMFNRTRRNAFKPQLVLRRPPDRTQWQRHNVGHGATRGFAEAAQTGYRGPQAAQKSRHDLDANRIIFGPKKLANPTIQLSGYADQRRHSCATLNDTILSDVDSVN